MKFFRKDTNGTLTTSLVSYWNMQGNSNDFWGTHNGTDTAITYSTGNGKVNQGAGFDGSTSKITFTSSDTMPTSALSVFGWIKVSSFNTLGQPVLVGGTGSNNAAWFFRTTATASGETSQGIAFEIWGNVAVYSNANVLTAGTWACVGFKWDGTNITLYVNGVDVTNTRGGSNKTPPGWALNNNGGIGYAFGGTTCNAHMNGCIDELAYWSKALSSTEISDLYNGGAGQTMINIPDRYHPYRGSIGRFFRGDPTLAGYWQLDGSSIDNSGNGNNGTDTAVSYSPAYSKFSGGQGAYFNGSAQIALPSALVNQQIKTVALWFYVPNTWPSSEVGLVDTAVDGSNGWKFIISGSSWVGFLQEGGSTPITLSYASSNFSPNRWYHLAATVDGSGNAVFYVNGIARASGNGTYTATTNTTKFGAENRSGYNFTGYLDEIVAFSRALSPAEISQYYQWATSAQKKSWYALLTAILLSLSEAVTNTDTFLKGLYRSFIEAVTNTDTFSGIKVLFALFTEAVQSTDTLIKTIGKNLSEAVQNTDSLIKGVYRNFAEAVTNSDTFNAIKFMILNLFESVKSTTSLWINGMFIDAWWTKRIKPVINWIKRNKPQ
jgi:hypothetical protein